MFMTFPEVLILKEIMTKKFNKYLHFHDSCGGQYFSSYNIFMGKLKRTHIKTLVYRTEM